MWTTDTSNSEKPGWSAVTPSIRTKRKGLQKNTTGKALVLGNQQDWMNMWSACALMHTAWRTNRRKQSSVCSYKAMVSSGSWRHCRMTHMTRLMPWMNKGFWGRTSWEGNDRKMPFMWESSRNAWALPWDGWWASWEIMGQDGQGDQHRWHLDRCLLQTTWSG